MKRTATLLLSSVLVLTAQDSCDTENDDADQDGYTESKGDCDDYDPDIYPGAPEVCDEYDNDCDEVVDEGCDAFPGVEVIVGGDLHSVALDASGQVYGWGSNDAGQLGDGTWTDRLAPVPIPGIEVRGISSGANHILAMASADRTLYVWGDNRYGQLGDGTTVARNSPISIALPEALGHLAGGGGHSLTLDMSGVLWAWGDNRKGQAGASQGQSTLAPREVGNQPVCDDIAAGGEHSLCVSLTDGVYAWGSNESGQLGIPGLSGGTYTPTRVGGLPPGVVAIAAGLSHSVALDDAGQVWAWGDNSAAQIGPNGTSPSTPEPARVGGLPMVTSIAAGGDHTLALGEDGRVYAWGSGSEGQLGDGAQTTSAYPVVVDLGGPATHIGAGYYHSLAVDLDGTAWAWGDNYEGQLGDGTRYTRTLPVPVSDLP